MAKFEIPDPPVRRVVTTDGDGRPSTKEVVLPEAVQAKWRKAYADAFEQAQIDHEGDVSMQRAVATREANKVLRVPKISSFDDAMALDDHHVVKREESKDKKTLLVVTSDAKKYRFPIPEKKKSEPAKKNDSGQGATT